MSKFQTDENGNLVQVASTVYHPNGAAPRDAEGRLIDGPRAGEIDEPAESSGEAVTETQFDEAVDRVRDIVAAIGKLRERSDPEDWTPSSGKPKLMPLETILGYQITQTERDAAWRLVLSDSSTPSATTEA